MTSLTWWQQYIVIPGILTFLAACQAKKDSLGVEVIDVIRKVRDSCNLTIGPN